MRALSGKEIEMIADVLCWMDIVRECEPEQVELVKSLDALMAHWGIHTYEESEEIAKAIKAALGGGKSTFTFEVHHSGERAAGIWPYSDEITVNVQSGDPGGVEGEFTEHVRESLAQWFDGADVKLKKEGE